MHRFRVVSAYVQSRQCEDSESSVQRFRVVSAQVQSRQFEDSESSVVSRFRKLTGMIVLGRTILVQSCTVSARPKQSVVELAKK